jgi:nucleotide-binding universal stress UspA family protein
MFKRILVGLDGSPGSEQALAKAIELTRLQQADLWAVSVAEVVPRYVETIDEVAEASDHANAYFSQLQRQAYDRAKQAGIEFQAEILVGHAAHAVVEFAATHDIDLVVIGHSGHTSIWGQFLGTTADKIVRHAPCSVLVVRAEASDE